MGILEKLLGRDRPRDTLDLFETTCPHTSLAQRWRSADEMGSSAYVCTACGEEMSYEEAREILEPAQPALSR